MEKIDRDMERLIKDLQNAARSYRNTDDRREKEKFARIYEDTKQELMTKYGDRRN